LKNGIKKVTNYYMTSCDNSQQIPSCPVECPGKTVLFPVQKPCRKQFVAEKT
jgi:hypothetical protein